MESDFSRMVNSYNDAGLFKRFINVVKAKINIMRLG